MHLDSGTVIDRYTIENQIGQGGMAVVYRARHNQLGTVHAIKVLMVPSQSIRNRLLTEGRVQATLRHANIVSVTDVIDVGGSPGLVMELVHGPSLDQLLRQVRLSVDQADELARGILAGVAQAHRHGLIHRDLKPANVMLQATDSGFIPKVTDFGLAKILDVEEGFAGTQTRSGVAMGTPCYMAPEQVRNAKGVDKRADVFSLGALLYELVSGVRAFGGADLFEIFNAVTSGTYTSVRESAPNAPDRMVRAIEAALQVDREARVADCDKLLAIWTGQDAQPERSGPWTAEMLAKVRSPPAPARPEPSSGTWEGGPPGPSSESIDPAPLGARPVAPMAPIHLGLSAVVAAGKEAALHAGAREASGPTLAVQSADQPPILPGQKAKPAPAGDAASGEYVTAARRPVPPGLLVLGAGGVAAFVAASIVWATQGEFSTADAPGPEGSLSTGATVEAEGDALASTGNAAPVSPVDAGHETAVTAPLNLAGASSPGATEVVPRAAITPAPETPSKSAVATDAKSRAASPSPSPAKVTPKGAPVVLPEATAPPATAAPPAAVATGVLAINSRPWSIIKLDGVAAGRTGMWKRELASGRHEIKLISSDERVATKTVNIEANSEASFCWDFDLGADCPK